jgi:hypothetical protein
MIMQFISILQLIAVIGTLATGVVSLFWPHSVQNFTGLSANGGRGITEIRSILGALFIGLAVAAYLLDHAVSYPMLGIMYLAIAAVRTVSMFVDQSVEQSNIISIAVEVLFGVILIL